MKTIKIIAPANSIVGEKNSEILRCGMEKLKKVGFDVICEKNIYSIKNHNYAGLDSEKLDDIYSAFTNSDIVLCATGGINCNTILNKMNYKKLNNKKQVLIGNSNNCILLNVLSEKCNIKTYLGPNLKSLGKFDSTLSIKNFSEKLCNGNPELLFSQKPSVINDGIVVGKTFGGTGSTLRRIIGTRYFPKFENKIMILEFNKEESSPIEVMSILSQFEQIGIFDKICGLILGEYSNDISIYSLIEEYIKNKKYPVIISNDFGHNVESTFLPIGTMIYMNTKTSQYYELDGVDKYDV